MELTQQLLDHYFNKRSLYLDDPIALEYIDSKINALSNILIELYYD